MGLEYRNGPQNNEDNNENYNGRRNSHENDYKNWSQFKERMKTHNLRFCARFFTVKMTVIILPCIAVKERGDRAE